MCRRRFGLAAVLVCLLACGKGAAPDGSCQHDFDCPTGQSCVSGQCQALPCGGCQADQACGTDGKCVLAQGALCSAVVACPAGFPCNSGGTCAKPCTVNADCEAGFVCNSGLKSCTQCTSNSDCTGTKGKPVCDTDGRYPASATADGKGVCVACDISLDCVKALGSGHFCEAHACKVGCATDNDCNAGANETCDTSTTPGKCIQCHNDNDCSALGATASACDDTNHCVQCWGSTQGAANNFCSSGTPECNLTTKTCVACLAANNPNGADCGYLNGGTKDPHDEKTCNPDTSACVDGCQVDAQCGCPRTGVGGTESACSRYALQEHCDPARTTSADVSGATLGACVECRPNTNTDCEFKITHSTQYAGAYATLNGARCVNDSCVEGCDVNEDCYPNHVSDGTKICHIGPVGDPNNHKCVQCACDAVSDDGTFCEYKADLSTRACPNTATGHPQVCDHDTLQCRRKHQGETCLTNAECGAAAAGSTCSPFGTGSDGFCMKQFNGTDTCTGGACGPFYCVAGAQTGRCADTCDGICSCQSGSICGNGSDPGGAGGKVCAPASCNCSISSCPP